MIEEHRHIWAVTGCYCGAQRCGHIEPVKLPDGVRPTKKDKAAVNRCKNAADRDSLYCSEQRKPAGVK